LRVDFVDHLGEAVDGAGDLLGEGAVEELALQRGLGGGLLGLLGVNGGDGLAGLGAQTTTRGAVLPSRNGAFGARARRRLRAVR